MHHVRVALDRHLLGDLDATDGRHPANVVASQIEQHDVLGDLLRIGEHLGGQCFVRLSAGTARPGAGDRPQRDYLALLAHQDLG